MEYSTGNTNTRGGRVQEELIADQLRRSLVAEMTSVMENLGSTWLEVIAELESYGIDFGQFSKEDRQYADYNPLACWARSRWPKMNVCADVGGLVVFTQDGSIEVPYPPAVEELHRRWLENEA